MSGLALEGQDEVLRADPPKLPQSCQDRHLSEICRVIIAADGTADRLDPREKISCERMEAHDHGAIHRQGVPCSPHGRDREAATAADQPLRSIALQIATSPRATWSNLGCRLHYRAMSLLCRIEAGRPGLGAYSSAFTDSQRQTKAAHPDWIQASPMTPYLSNNRMDSPTCRSQPAIQTSSCDHGIPNAERNCDTIDVIVRKKTPGSNASKIPAAGL